MPDFGVQVFEFVSVLLAFFFFLMFLILFFSGRLNVDSIRVIISRNIWVIHKLSIWNQDTKIFG